LKKTHIVQSHRSLIERQIGSLKFWQVLQGGQCNFIDQREKELDACMALENLMQMLRDDKLDTIPARAPHLADAHIITPEEIPFPKIPTKMEMTDADFPPHLKRLHAFLTSHATILRNWLFDASRDQIFSNRQEKRAENLVKGANVLQVRAHERMDGVWIIRGEVGASMRGGSYVVCLELIQGTNEFWSRCECKSG